MLLTLINATHLVYSNSLLYCASTFGASLYHRFYMHTYLNIYCRFLVGSQISVDDIGAVMYPWFIHIFNESYLTSKRI